MDPGPPHSPMTLFCKKRAKDWLEDLDRTFKAIFASAVECESFEVSCRRATRLSIAEYGMDLYILVQDTFQAQLMKWKEDILSRANMAFFWTVYHTYRLFTIKFGSIMDIAWHVKRHLKVNWLGHASMFKKMFHSFEIVCINRRTI